MAKGPFTKIRALTDKDLNDSLLNHKQVLQYLLRMNLRLSANMGWVWVWNVALTVGVIWALAWR